MHQNNIYGRPCNIYQHGWTFLAYCFLQMMLCCAVFYNMMNYACYIGLFCNLSTTVTKCMWDICLGGFTWDQPVVFVLSTGCLNLNWDLKTKFSDLNILRLSIQVFHVRKISLKQWQICIQNMTSKSFRVSLTYLLIY